jgi:acetyl-CoA carboxylase carboxyltransferase component
MGCRVASDAEAVCALQELGGAAMHTSKSGVADHMAETEEEALKKA